MISKKRKKNNANLLDDNFKRIGNNTTTRLGSNLTNQYNNHK